MSYNNSIEYQLTQWGIWVRTQQGIPRYVSPAWAMMRDNVQLNRDPDANITEDDALRIDRAIAALNLVNSSRAVAVWTYYRYQGMSYRRLGQLMGIHADTAGNLVIAGAAWIEGAITYKESA